MAAVGVEDVGDYEEPPSSVAGVTAGFANLRVGQLKYAWFILVCFHLKHYWCSCKLYSKIEAETVVAGFAAEDVAAVR